MSGLVYTLKNILQRKHASVKVYRRPLKSKFNLNSDTWDDFRHYSRKKVVVKKTLKRVNVSMHPLNLGYVIKFVKLKFLTFLVSHFFRDRKMTAEVKSKGRLNWVLGIIWSVLLRMVPLNASKNNIIF